MLKLYTSTSFLTDANRGKVFPLLFDLFYTKNPVICAKYKLVNAIELADIVVFPLNYAAFLKHDVEFLELLQLSKNNKKPIWIYTAGDYGFTNYIKEAYTFRLGGFDSRLDKNTFIIPSFINDPYQVYLKEGFSVLKKEINPSIGFVGHAQSGVIKYLKEYTNHLKFKAKRQLNRLLADNQSFYPSSIKRALYLGILAQNDELNTQFVLRNKYRAGSLSALTQKESSQQFYNNIFNNAYTFCLRGVGNFSVRFYETLAVGRIPVLLNTDCRLPLQSNIEWGKHCLIIDLTSKVSIGNQILEFHENLTPVQFENMQISNRNLWLNTLKRESYFISIHNYFKTNLL